MRPGQSSSRWMTIITAAFLVLLAFTQHVNAQQTTATDASASSPAGTTSDASAPAQTTAGGTTAPPPATSSSAQETGSSISANPTTSQQQPTGKLPGLTSNLALPSLATASLPGVGNVAVPSYQVIIPNMAGNPFLAMSPYPDGLVFIVVGTTLAGVALVLLGWRLAYTWYLHHKTAEHRKAAFSNPEMNERPFTAKGPSPTGPSPTVPFARDISLQELLRPGDRRSQVSSYSTRPSTGRPSTSAIRPGLTVNSLLPSSSIQFYSPSAHPGATTAAALGTQPADRNSNYLPAGYYLRDSPVPSPTNLTSSPRQTYGTPTSPSFLLSDLGAPIPRLSRSPTAASSVISNPRPMTTYAPSSSARPLSTYTTQQGGTIPPRRPLTEYAPDRRTKPSQALDDLLGGGR
jgi:hypothetical protein